MHEPHDSRALVERINDVSTDSRACDDECTRDSVLPGCWQDATDALSAGVDRLILYGPPGTGKTYAGLTLGDVSGGAYRLICTEDMTAGDVTGHFMPTAAGTWTWLEGSVVKAWRGNGQRGGRIVADEIDRAGGDVLSLLLNMFDSDGSAYWHHPETGTIHRPLDGFSAVMTTNIEDLAEIPRALRDRFPIAIRIDRPHPDALALLPASLRAPASMSADAEHPRRFSIRSFRAFDHLRQRGFSTERAARMVFGALADDVLDALRVDSVDPVGHDLALHST
jgi:hypothetical protein